MFDVSSAATYGTKAPAPQFAAVIPAFNEARSIEAVVQHVSHRALAIVVDDGSTDNTAVLARTAGAYVVSHPVNRGYDCALETGLRTAIILGCTFAVTIDADGQHDPSLLDRFNSELNAGADFVVGKRDQTQRWSETLFCILGRVVWGLNDPLCGMKGYRLSILDNAKNINTYRSIGTELAIRLVKGGVKARQILVETRPRQGDSRFGRGLKANIAIIKALWIGLMNTSPISPSVSCQPVTSLVVPSSPDNEMSSR
jgi:glycosyltransferase involved in cell wall biosynthesis